MPKKWTVIDYDIARLVAQKTDATRISIPKTMRVQVVLDLEDELYGKLVKNPTWLQKLQEMAKEKADPVVANIIKTTQQIDGKASKFDKKIAATFSRDFESNIRAQLTKASDEMADAAEKLYKDYIKGRHELTKFRVKSVGKITLNGAVTIAVTAATVATGGAISPIGIVGIVRTGVGIVQECAKLASTADAVAKLIQGEFKILQAIMKKNLADASVMKKIGQGVKEVGLNVFSQVIGVETPSLKNCEGHIELHKINISKLEKKSRSMSEQIYAAMDKQASWQKEFDKAKKSLPANKVGKVKTKLDKVETALDTLIKSTIAANEAVENAFKRQKLFEETLNAMKKGLPGWLKYVDVAIGLGMSVGLAFADAGSAIEKTLSAVIDVETSIATELIDHI